MKNIIIVGKSDTKIDTFDTIVFANRDIEHVSIPKFIKYIKPYAFECCTKLKAIEFSEDSEIVSIGKKAFGSTNIESFFIPSSLEKLDGCINYESKLTRITIPPSNKNFGYLDEEHQIIVGKSDTNKDIFDTILFANRDIKQATIPCFIKYIKSYALNRCDQLNHVEFSENSELLFIGKYAFCHTSIEVITIPKSVTEIEKYAFCSCNELKKVSLEEGSNLISLERGIFSFDGRLTTFEIPMDSKLQHFCANVFMLSSIESVYIPENVDRIDSDWCCDTKKLKEVKISPFNKHFKYLDEEHQIIVGKSDIKGEKFDTIVFVSRRLENIIIPKYIKYILSSAFDDCKSIETISIPEDSELISIPNNFASKSIKSLFIPQSVEAIENSWCHNEDKLNSVVISPSNKNFSYLDEKHQIIVGKSDTKGDIFDTIIFANRDIQQITIPKHIKYIKTHAFYHCQQLKHFAIENNSELEKIGKFAFGHSSLKSIIIPKNVRKISRCAFFSCDDLEKFLLEDGSKLESFEDDLFFSCDSLREVSIPEDSSLRIIKEDAFDFSSITSLFIPKSIEVIQNGLFRYAQFVKTVTISPLNKNYKYLDENHQVIIGKSSIKEKTFDTIVFANRDIKNVSIPRSIKFISASSFMNCKKLKRIDIPDDSEIESIGEKAFDSTSLDNFIFPRKICKYENEFLSSSTKIRYIEFLGDGFIDDENDSLFKELKKLVLVSFPNIQNLSIQFNQYIFHFPKEFSLFINHGVDVDLTVKETSMPFHYISSDSYSDFYSDSD